MLKSPRPPPANLDTPIMVPRTKLLSILLCGISSAGLAADLDFYKDIYPFLKANCIACHNKTTAKADLDMETPELMIKGGESGPGLVPGKSAESLVVLASLHKEDMEMPPPNNKSGAVELTQAEIALLKQWIDQGAKSSVRQEHAVTWRPVVSGVHPIYNVAITSDGRYAACGRSNQIDLYDLATQQFIARLADPAEKAAGAHRGLVQALAFSPDGARLASGSFREVKIWKLAPSKSSGINPVSDTPAAPKEDLIKKISETGKIAVVCSSLSADGSRVATGCSDGSVRIWDAASARQLNELRGSKAAFLQTAELQRRIDYQGLEQAFQKAQIDRITAENKALEELLKKANDTMATMKKLLPEKQKAITTAVAATAAASKAVAVLKAQTQQLTAGKVDAALDAKLKKAEDALITAQTAETSAVAASAATESNLKDAEDEATRIAESKSRNSGLMASATQANAAARTTQDKASTELQTLRQTMAKNPAKPVAVKFLDGTQQVLATFSDDTRRTWAVATSMPVDEGKAPEPASSAPQWTLERVIGGNEHRDLFTDRVNAVRFSPDGKTLAAASGEPSRTGDVLMFDITTGAITQQFKSLHEDTVLSLDFSPDGNSLATGSADKMVKIIDLKNPPGTRTFEGHTHHVAGVSFRADGRVLASAGSDGLVLCWDMLSGERKKKIEGWTKEVTAIQFIGATNQFVTSAGDNLVRILSDEGKEVRALANLPDYMQSAACSPVANTLIAGGEDSVLRVWEMSTGKELTTFAAQVGTQPKAPQK